MSDLIAKLAIGQMPTDADLTAALYETCEALHAGDCESCPVYIARDGKISSGGRSCATFKDGAAMLAAIRDAAGWLPAPRGSKP